MGSQGVPHCWCCTGDVAVPALGQGYQISRSELELVPWREDNAVWMCPQMVLGEERKGLMPPDFPRSGCTLLPSTAAASVRGSPLPPKKAPKPPSFAANLPHHAEPRCAKGSCVPHPGRKAHAHPSRSSCSQRRKILRTSQGTAINFG